MQSMPVKVESSRKWKPVPLDPDLLDTGDFDGLAGIEILTDYTLVKSKDNSEVADECEVEQINPKSQDANKSEGKGKKKKRKTRSGKPPSNITSNFPTIEEETNVNDAIRCTTRWKAYALNPMADFKSKQHLKVALAGKRHGTTSKADTGDIDQVPVGMDAWNGLGVPVSVLHALAEMGFTAPTNIQSLTLPAAIFGRRDILGAAETGSGKTLAFGIPILSGILQARLKDEDEAEDHCTEFNNAHEENEEVGKGQDDSNLVDDSDLNESGDDNDNLNEETSGKQKAELVQVIDDARFDFLFGQEKIKGVRPRNPLYALVLTPTRELAMQVTEHLQSAAKYTGINIAVVVGGMSSQKQNRILNRGPEIVVATPGRLWDLISEGHPHLLNVENIKYLAIDETDRMLEKGHFEELQRLLDRINANIEQKGKRQNFVFSATLSLTHDVPHYIKKNKKKAGLLKITSGQKLSSIMETVGLTNPKVVDITETSGVAHSLTEAQIVCSLEEKDYYLYYFLIRYPGRTLVFCNSINCVKRLTQLFSLLQCPISPLHANMHQSQRLKNLERFRDNSQCVLLATDVAARGLDIPKVQHVIHYQAPRTAETYVHRSGRTARAHEEGLTVIFVEPGEIQKFSRLFRTLGRDHILPCFPVEEKLMPAVKQRVNLASQLEALELQERRSTSERGWMSKLAKEMDIEISDNEFSEDEISPPTYLTSNMKKKVDYHRKQLNALLKKPLFPKGFSFKFPTFTNSNIAVPLSNSTTRDGGNDEKSAITVLKQDMERKRAEKRKHVGNSALPIKSKVKIPSIG